VIVKFAKFIKQLCDRGSALKELPSPILAFLTIGLSSLAVTSGLLLLRSIGGLQPLELAVYDQMLRLRPNVGADPRLLIVAITEADIKAEGRYPLTDQTIATALQRLQQHQPAVIGLDLYRDLPQEPGNAALAQQLQQSNVIAIRKISDAEEVGVAPPPNLPPDRVGFNDIVTDPDNVVRRNLIIGSLDDDTVLYSFSLRLALAYLQPQGILPQTGLIDPHNLRLGKTELFPLNADSGAYHPIDARGYQLLLDYRDRDRLAHQITLTQLLQGNFDPKWVRNKIVLVGAIAHSTKDYFHTPYSAVEAETPWMAGVEIHAQMLSQLLTAVLDQRPLTGDWSDWAEILWIAGWAGVGGSLAWVIRHLLVSGLVGIGAMSLLLTSSYVLFLHHRWVPVAAPAIALATSATAIVTYRAQQAQRQQIMMMKLLGQNTSPEIATALWKSRDRLLKSGKLPGQRLVATILFTDIKNFSTISEAMPPENLLEWLNEYLSVITQEVRANQGIINKFTGDGMLAVFGVPINRTTPIEVSQDAQLAVACALAMGERLHQLNQEWQTRHLPTIQMRVGIFTGPIVAGSLGCKDRLEYGVIGDSVNTAARLEGYEKDRQPNTEICRVLIAHDTLVHLQNKFVVEPWGPATLKGKHHLVEVYRVLGRADGKNAPIPTDIAIRDGSVEATDPIVSNQTALSHDTEVNPSG
jgi:CHASE2 domain-containing sensor protein/class 3 adenylate cyclase